MSLTLTLAVGCTAAPAAPHVIDGVVGDGPESQAHRLDLSTGRLEALAPAPSFPYGTTPDGGLLLSVSDDIVLRDTQGNLRPIATSSGVDWRPRLHPDGQRLLFESSRGSFRDIYLTRLDAPETVTRLTDNREGIFDAAWSPDGRRICFSSSRHGQLDLFGMTADGREQQRWTRHVGDAVRCAFAPSGRNVAYVSARDGRDDVLLIDEPGASPRNLTRSLGPGGSHVERFAWHPTEDRMLVALVGSGQGEVWVVEGDERRRLTPEGAHDTEPTWSPFGDAVLLTRKGEGLITLRASGGPARAVHPESKLWRPRWRAPLTEGCS